MREEWSNRQKLWFLAGSAVIILAVFLGFKYIFPLAAPFVIAYLIALMIEKPVNALAKVFRGCKMIASTIIVLVFSALLCTVLGAIVYFGIGEIRAFIKNYDYNMVSVRQTAARICYNIDGWLGLADGQCLEFICRCMEQFEKAVSGGAGSQMMTKVVSLSFPAVVKIITVVGAVIICFISVVFLSTSLDSVRNWRRTSRFHREISAVADSLHRLIDVYFKIELIIMAINASLCTIALMIIKNPYAVVIGITIGIVDALPVFGTGTVLLPWALFELVNKNITSAAVLVTVYVITYFVREIMESKCLGDRVGISPFVMLMVIFVGLLVYGLFGFILGPVSFCIMKALILYLKTEIEHGKIASA